jgi:hypothetical protein
MFEIDSRIVAESSTNMIVLIQIFPHRHSRGVESIPAQLLSRIGILSKRQAFVYP